MGLFSTSCFVILLQLSFSDTLFPNLYLSLSFCRPSLPNLVQLHSLYRPLALLLLFLRLLQQLRYQQTDRLVNSIWVPYHLENPNQSYMVLGEGGQSLPYYYCTIHSSMANMRATNDSVVLQFNHTFPFNNNVSHMQ